ncbi:hypothetical protein [Merismopedia glauca]|uniref:Uncharacterized protein n=1 Tax=Merismopedia glauca CCAP 1448/3 TaxID=1296344 RepID=A0A2T1BXV3_9CYAN|nr:hypothetical protein [Merismopedia glauca]PSB00840.1 hypothetical protein C7B64_21450 [Merismopedia glauca CCAP 1448/3]
MKIKPSVVLISLLILSMIGGGLATGFVGMTLGDEALKGVTQPENRPTKKLAGDNQTPIGRDGLEILNEQDIVAKVKAKIYTESKTKTKTKTKGETKKKKQQRKTLKKDNQ